MDQGAGEPELLLHAARERDRRGGPRSRRGRRTRAAPRARAANGSPHGCRGPRAKKRRFSSTVRSPYRLKRWARYADRRPGRIRPRCKVDAGDRDRACVRPQRADQEAQHRRLAGAVGTDEAVGLSGTDRQVHPIDRRDGPERAADSLRLDEVHGPKTTSAGMPGFSFPSGRIERELDGEHGGLAALDGLDVPRRELGLVGDPLDRAPEALARERVDADVHRLAEDDLAQAVLGHVDGEGQAIEVAQRQQGGTRHDDLARLDRPRQDGARLPEPRGRASRAAHRARPVPPPRVDLGPAASTWASAASTWDSAMASCSGRAPATASSYWAWAVATAAFALSRCAFAVMPGRAVLLGTGEVGVGVAGDLVGPLGLVDAGVVRRRPARPRLPQRRRPGSRAPWRSLPPPRRRPPGPWRDRLPPAPAAPRAGWRPAGPARRPGRRCRLRRRSPRRRDPTPPVRW